MTGVAPTTPGWYEVARQTQRWWDRHRWGEDVVHQGRRTTATAVRRSVVRMQWVAVMIGIVAWCVFLVTSFSFGVSAAFALAALPVVGSGAIAFAAIAGSRLIAALPPTPQEPGPYPLRDS